MQTRHAYFIPSSCGALFALHYVASISQAKGTVLLIPPFGEELNKCCRMMHSMATTMSAQGYHCVLFDLYGTGDSSGEFFEATWSLWLSNIADMMRWTEQQGLSVTHFLGIRSGALLLGDYLARYPTASFKSLLLWQPMIEGREQVDFIQRLARLQTTPESSSSDEMLQVAGYRMAPDLLADLHKTRLIDLKLVGLRDIAWFDVVASEDSLCSEPISAILNHWKAHSSCTYHKIVGAPFWNTQEIVTVPELILQTMDHMHDGAHA